VGKSRGQAPEGGETTIENRVYLFDSLAAQLLAGEAGELLVSEKEADRARARRALADLAYVSCVVSDTGHLDAHAVRAEVLSDAPPPPPAPAPEAPDKARKRGKGKGAK
jgi:phosphoribosyl-ATP pyrophosphohydrolase